MATCRGDEAVGVSVVVACGGLPKRDLRDENMAREWDQCKEQWYNRELILQLLIDYIYKKWFVVSE